MNDWCAGGIQNDLWTLLLWVLCHLTGFTRLVWGRSKCSPSFLIQSDLCIVYVDYSLCVWTNCKEVCGICVLSMLIILYVYGPIVRRYAGFVYSQLDCLLQLQQWFVYQNHVTYVHESWRIWQMFVLTASCHTYRWLLCCHVVYYGEVGGAGVEYHFQEFNEPYAPS